MVNETAGNERNMNRTLKVILLSAGLCSLPSLSFSQTTVYDNLTSPDPLGQQYSPTPTGLQFGDQISLIGTDRTLSQFSFYYFFSGATASTQSVTVRMYANGTNAPATPFYTSDPIPLSTGANGFNNQSINFPLSSNVITLPDSFTWTVQFSNLAASETGGLLLYGPPNVGSSLNEFWQENGSGVWSLNQINNGTTLADFAARVTAVPEPGIFALSGIGALLLAGLRRFRKTSG
jgi:hypothetical protein